MSIVIILVLFVLMWVVLIVPRQREVRRHQALVTSLEVGDEVMSSSGIYGTIRSLQDDHLDLEVAPGIVVRMAKRAVAAKVPPPEEADALAAALGGGDELDDEGDEAGAIASAGGMDEIDGGAVDAGGAHDDAGRAVDGGEPDGATGRPRPDWPTEGSGS